MTLNLSQMKRTIAVHSRSTTVPLYTRSESDLVDRQPASRVTVQAGYPSSCARDLGASTRALGAC